MKEFILKTWVKYHKRYGIRFIDFNIMDNHVHALVLIPSAKKLGDFMRLTNSRIALEINNRFARDSHALRERYKSPLVSSTAHALNTIGYIWLNRYRVGGIRPELDRFCSYYYRHNGRRHPLVASYQEFNLCTERDEGKFSRRLYEDMKKERLAPEVYEHGHTIADLDTIVARGIEISARLRDLKYASATAPPFT